MTSSPKTPPARQAQEGNTFPKADESHSDVFERPTIAPPFDLEEFARVKMAQPDERISLPDTPTMAEAGFNDFVFETYTALLAPVKTPPEIVGRLERETLGILGRADMREKLSQSGFQVQARDGKGHMARVAKEVPMYRQIIAQAGIKLQ